MGQCIYVCCDIDWALVLDYLEDPVKKMVFWIGFGFGMFFAVAHRVLWDRCKVGSVGLVLSFCGSQVWLWDSGKPAHLCSLWIFLTMINSVVWNYIAWTWMRSNFRLLWKNVIF
jgi:hypothetical protein